MNVQSLFGEDLAALEAAKEVAEQTQHAALAAAIDRELLAKWLKGTLAAKRFGPWCNPDDSMRLLNYTYK